MKLTPSQLKALTDTAAALGVRPSWLEALINFETAGTWNPQIKNPNSSARGLIQFLDSTAKGMGYPGGSAELVAKYPTIETQLAGPVLAYFRPYAPFQSEQEFYFTVFFPKYRKAPLDTVIHADDAAARTKFQAANPGIKTVGDYYNKLRASFARIHGVTPSQGGGLAVLALIAASTLFFLGA